MKVQEITVSAGRTFNHPYENYSNLKPHVSMTAVLDAGDDPIECAKELQAKAESLMEDHKRIMLKQLEDLEQMSRRQQQASRLEGTIRSAQQELDRLRDGTKAISHDGDEDVDSDDMPT